ncbi:MAG: pyridoxal phosphate-dependent aminotransferase [Acidobacteriia bacterium]|nr:pyridoxal phosphate-dependent aminotransferase [Terriglobia bacterium]
MFSSRLNWSQRPNRLSALLDEKRRGGTQVLDLTESNPTRAGLAYPEAEILAALADASALRYQPSPRGIDSAREAVAAYYRDRGTPVPAANVLLTASTSEAYAYLFKLLTNPGDEILAPRPSYPLFEFLADLESVRIRQYPLRYDGVWHIDFDALEQAITPRTRAIVVVNPNNPTGSFLKRAELDLLDRLAAERGLAVLSDEVFRDYAFGEDADRVSTLAGDRRALTFSMSGLSKIAGLPQMKLGWIIANGGASGPRSSEALDALELIADTYLSVSTPVQVALPRLLALSSGIMEQIRQRTASNLARLRETMHGSPATILRTEGGWYTVLQVPRTRTEEEWTLKLLGESDVLVQPGFFFDFESEAFLVLSLLSEPAAFAEGVSRIRSVI